MNERLPVVVLATADFDSPLWTNKQHLAVRLQAGGPVVYIESMGLRRPTLTLADLLRVARRLRRGRRATTSADDRWPRPTVVSPRVVPLHGSAFVRALNRRLVARSIQTQLPTQYVLWSFSPFTYGLEEASAAFVYHSVDLIHLQPHMPTKAILAAELDTLQRADAVVASSAGVRDHLTELGRRDVLLWENVADTALFSQRRAQRAPRAVFAGNLTPTKVDVAALQSVVDAGVDLVVCGPSPEDGTRMPQDVRRLLDHPRVDFLGTKSPSELAEVLATSSVGLIPYLHNGYTAGVFPLKVYEYLAAGLSVVSTPLPSLTGTPEEHVARVGAAEFGRAVLAAVDAFDEEGADDRRRFADPHSWETRTTQAETLIAALSDPRG